MPFRMVVTVQDDPQHNFCDGTSIFPMILGVTEGLFARVCSRNKAYWLSFMYENNEAFAIVEIIIAKSQYMHVHCVTFVLMFPESYTTIQCHYEKICVE